MTGQYTVCSIVPDAFPAVAALRSYNGRRWTAADVANTVGQGHGVMAVDEVAEVVVAAAIAIPRQGELRVVFLSSHSRAVTAALIAALRAAAKTCDPATATARGDQAPQDRLRAVGFRPVRAIKRNWRRPCQFLFQYRESK